MRRSDTDADRSAGRVSWGERVRLLKSELRALSLAVRDPRTPRVAKLVAACVVGYAFSPIDLIPDVIPLLGYLDDAILLPIGIWIAIRLIPDDVLEACRRRVVEVPPNPWGRIAVIVIISIWLALTLVSVLLLRRLFD